MANTLLTIEEITRSAAVILENELCFSRNVNRQYDSRFAREGAKIGDTLKLRLPNRYTVRSGASYSGQDTTEQFENLQLSYLRGVDMEFTNVEMTLDIQDFAERIIQPAVAELANEIDAIGLELGAKNTPNRVGTIGTTPSTTSVITDAMATLDVQATPRSRRFMCVDPFANAGLVEGVKGLFNPQADTSKRFRKGMMGRNILSFDEIGMDQNVYTVTTGTRSGTTLVDQATTAEGATTITVDGLGGATQTVKAGETFTIANVYEINPKSRKKTSRLQRFVVTADATGSGSEVDLSIYPAIHSQFASNPALQTVFVDEANLNAIDNNAVTFDGGAEVEYPVNLAFHRDAFVLGMADLELPGGVEQAARVNHNGMSLRIVRQYDIDDNKHKCRLDALFGWAMWRPLTACGIWG